MAGKNLFASFPELRKSLKGSCVETRGSMPEAAGVNGRKDAQWVVACPIPGASPPKGVYATGWSWSSYAYRLETSIRDAVRSKIADEKTKMPLLYVYVVVDQAVYGAPVAPQVNAEAIAKLKPTQKLKQGAVMTRVLTIAQRDFGVAIKLVPQLGPKVAIAVLRSET
jgi:hypothetical protein